MKKPVKLNLSQAVQKLTRLKQASTDADVLAVKYYETLDRRKDADGEMEEIKGIVRKLAFGKTGEDDGKRHFVKGKKFIVGFSRVDPSPYIDPRLLKKVLSPVFCKKLISTTVTETVDEQMFCQLIEAGKLPRTLVKKVTVVPKSTSDRFFCETIKTQ